MAINLDSVINNAKLIARGEAAGSMPFLIAAGTALAVWVGAFTLSGWGATAATALDTQNRRWTTLLTLADEYKNLPHKKQRSGNIDVPAVFAQIAEEMELGSRVNRISPDGRNQSIEINRLYAEEFVELERLLGSQGVKFMSIEIRALPSGSERLLSISAIIGPMN